MNQSRPGRIKAKEHQSRPMLIALFEEVVQGSDIAKKFSLLLRAQIESRAYY